MITLDGTLTFSAVNTYGILFGNLSFKNTVLLSAAYDFIKSSENGFSSVKPRYALILIEAMHISVTTIIFATVLLTDASELTSFVQFIITGAIATIGIALNADITVSPPLPNLGETVAPIAAAYPSSEPNNKPIIITNIEAPTLGIILSVLSATMLNMRVGYGNMYSSVFSSLCKRPFCHIPTIKIPKING